MPNDTGEPEIYLFDMDHTLVDNDCDVSWKEFLVTEGIINKSELDQADFFYEQYLRGELDTDAFIRYQLQEFKGKTPAQMHALTHTHFENLVKDKIYDTAKIAVEKALSTNKPVALLTATNRVIAEPLAQALNIPHILACEPALKDGVYTGNLAGDYSYGEGKIKFANRFCEKFNTRLEQVAYYGDSVSDIAILSSVGHPFATNPSDGLRQKAIEKNWTIINFK